MSKFTRQFILFGAPLFVGVPNLFHPVHFEPTGIYEGIHHVVNWWIILHVLNLFGFALLGLAAYLLIMEQQGLAAKIAKIGLAVFVPTYVGFDSIIGIGTGILVQYAKGVPLDKLAVLDPAINAFWTNNVATMLASIGSIAWGFSMSMSAVAFTESKRRPFVFVLGLIAGAISGWGYSASTFGSIPWWIAVALFGTTHVVPYGPLGMAFFVTAIALIEFAPRKAQITQMVEAATS
jgi:hypothetical protein